MSAHTEARRAVITARRGLITRLKTALSLAVDVRRERRDLTELTDRELRDIGLTRDQALREAGRGTFDLPHRR